MKIGLIIYGSLDFVSGGFLYDRKLVEYLTAQGHEVEVLSLPWKNYLTHLRDNFSAELEQKLRTAEYDVLLQDELNHPSLVWLNSKIRADIDYPLVTIVHLLRCFEPRAAWLNAVYRQVEAQYLRTVDGFIYNSRASQEMVEEIIGPTPQSVIAYPAADRFANQTPRPLPQEISPLPPLRILFVGAVMPRKGLHVLFKALERIPEVDWHLDVVGGLNVDLNYALAMQQYAALNKWEEKVKFWDILDHEALAVRYRTADVMILPSSYEGFGIVYLEAMSFGVPAVGTTFGAASEIITHGRDGFLIEPDDRQHLADIIRELHHNRPLLAELCQNARTRYEAHPSWDETCAKIEQFLQLLTRSKEQ